jgi:hypothetical protein
LNFFFLFAEKKKKRKKKKVHSFSPGMLLVLFLALAFGQQQLQNAFRLEHPASGLVTDL